MNTSSSLLLLGVGTAGSLMARGVNRAFGEGLKYVLTDTDASSGQDGEPFLLLGGDRLSGHGSGGDIVTARLATEDSVSLLSDYLSGIRLVVIVTALGGGTGGGATLEIVKHLNIRGIPSIVFATTPFSFEGEIRKQNTNGILSMIEEEASASFFLPLDNLVNGVDQMSDALRRGVDTLASAVTLFWRLIEKPGYIRLDAERLRHIIKQAGRGRFATITTQGLDRANEALDFLSRSPMLADGSAPVQAILCGILAGEDLRLSEIGFIANGVKDTFGKNAILELATVNDEQTFTGRLSIVLMLFELSGRIENEPSTSSVIGSSKKNRKPQNVLATGPKGRGRFNNSEPTLWGGEDLDIPTFVRKSINLDL